MDTVLAGALLSTGMAVTTLLMAIWSAVNRRHAEERERQRAEQRNREFFGLP
jgi:hypothetical protein